MKSTTYRLKDELTQSYSEREKRDFGHTKCPKSLSRFVFCLKLDFLHYVQPIAWSIMLYIYGGMLSCVGYYCCFLISLQEFLYLLVSTMCAWKYPASILFSMYTMGWKEKVLYVLSAEKYFLLVLGENGSDRTVKLTRVAWVAVTYVSNWAAIFALAFGKPPLPLAIMLLFFAIGGFSADILGALFGNWAETKVSTAALRESRLPVSTILAGACILLLIKS